MCLPLAAAVRSYAMTPLQTEPGTHHSNARLNTGARVRDVVSKIAYEEFMQQRLFGPLGMKDTTFWPSEEQAQRVAKSAKSISPLRRCVRSVASLASCL